KTGAYTRRRALALGLTTCTRREDRRRSSSPRPHEGENIGARAHHVHTRGRTSALELTTCTCREERRHSSSANIILFKDGYKTFKLFHLKTENILNITEGDSIKKLIWLSFHQLYDFLY